MSEGGGRGKQGSPDRERHRFEGSGQRGISPRWPRATWRRQEKGGTREDRDLEEGKTGGGEEGGKGAMRSFRPSR